MRSDPKPLSDWLQNPSSEAGGLLAKVQQIQTLTLDLQVWLNTPDPCPWASAVRVASFEDGTLTIYCTDASSLTLFRYRSLDAMKFFRQKLGESCARIETKVRPLTQASGR
ncbi:MAG: hypothetical protein AABY95_04590 [Pseudomonadota bacterium]